MEDLSAKLRVVADQQRELHGRVGALLDGAVSHGFVTDSASQPLNRLAVEFRSGSAQAAQSAGELAELFAQLAQTLADTDSQISRALGLDE